MNQGMRRHAETAVITAFFILTGLAPYGLSVDLTYPVIHLSLDLSLEYVGLLVALALVLSLRWGGIGRFVRLLGRVATWCLLGIVVVQLCSNVVGVLSGNGTLHFIMLWPGAERTFTVRISSGGNNDRRLSVLASSNTG
jgi:hypothetical protein